MMAERTDFYGSNTPKCPKSPCSFQKTGCSFHSFEPILSKRAKKKSPENPLVYWTFWRRVRDSNPRFLLGTRHFECRTFDLSDNSPYISSVILAPEECKKNTQERYEIVKSEPAQSPVRRTFSADETAGASKNIRLITLQLIQHQLISLYHTLTPFATLFPDRLAVLQVRPQKNGNTPRFFYRNVL